MNGIQAELNPCSGNSTVSDFRLNKGTMFYFYPCLRKEGWLTRTPKLLLVPHMCGEEKLCVWRVRVCEDTEILSSGGTGKCVQKQHEELLSAACRALTRALTPAPPSPTSAPLYRGFPVVSDRRGGQVKWAIPIQGRERCADSPCEMAAHFARSIRSFSPLCAAIAREQKQAGKWVWRRAFCTGGCLCLCASV